MLEVDCREHTSCPIGEPSTWADAEERTHLRRQIKQRSIVMSDELFPVARLVGPHYLSGWCNEGVMGVGVEPLVMHRVHDRELMAEFREVTLIEYPSAIVYVQGVEFEVTNLGIEPSAKRAKEHRVLGGVHAVRQGRLIVREAHRTEESVVGLAFKVRVKGSSEQSDLMPGPHEHVGCRASHHARAVCPNKVRHYSDTHQLPPSLHDRRRFPAGATSNPFHRGGSVHSTFGVDVH